MVNLELGDEMLAQIEALSGAPSEKAHTTTLKFDGKGTPHIMYRDGDDKLIHDTAIKTMEITPSYNDELKRELREDGSEIAKQSKKLNRIFIFFCVMLALAVISSLIIVVTLR